MNKLLPWCWHVGSDSSVTDDQVYDLDECDTHDAAIASGLRETPIGEKFHIIEARLYDYKNPPWDGICRFVRQRNHEICEVMADGLVICTLVKP